ncbi:MAG: hypothetical protein ACE5G0_17660 [Rhodothermales bacterium]
MNGFSLITGTAPNVQGFALLLCATLLWAVGCSERNVPDPPVISPYPTITFVQQIDTTYGSIASDQVALVIARHYAQSLQPDVRNLLLSYSGPAPFEQKELVALLKQYPTLVNQVNLEGLPWVRSAIE